MELSDRYGVTRIVALPRDSEWAFTYWEIAQGTVRGIASQMGHEAFSQSRRILRVYEITDLEFDGSNAHSSFDIDVGCVAVNWYIRVPAPGRSYVIDLGLLTPAGVFVLFTRSNTFHMPRKGVSEILDEEWSSPGLFHLTRCHPLYSPGGSSGGGIQERVK